MEKFVNIFVFLMILGVCMIAVGSVDKMNELINKTDQEQSKTEAQLVAAMEENETIRGFRANKKLAEFILEAPSSKIKLVLAPSKERKSKTDLPKTRN